MVLAGLLGLPAIVLLAALLHHLAEKALPQGRLARMARSPWWTGGQSAMMAWSLVIATQAAGQIPVWAWWVFGAEMAVMAIAGCFGFVAIRRRRRARPDRP